MMSKHSYLEEQYLIPYAGYYLLIPALIFFIVQLIININESSLLSSLVHTLAILLFVLFFFVLKLEVCYKEEKIDLNIKMIINLYKLSFNLNESSMEVSKNKSEFLGWGIRKNDQGHLGFIFGGKTLIRIDNNYFTIKDFDAFNSMLDKKINTDS